MKKIKVALICHFSNPLVRERLELQPEGRHYHYVDSAGWNTNIINGLENQGEVDLHVIAPHIGMKKRIQEFVVGEVHYHFFNPDFQYPWAYFDHSFISQKSRNYPRNRRIIKRFVKKINPALVNLIGAENPYYSLSALDIDNIPLFLSLQTVYANPERLKKEGRVDKYRWDKELLVFHATPYMCCTGRMYYDLIKKYEPKSIVFPRKWPNAKFPEIPDVKKQYDFAFFSRTLSKKKGFDAAIDAMAEVMETHPDVKLIAVGAKNADWHLFESRIQELGLQNNVIVHEPFPIYTDMLQYVKQAEYALLPVTMDVISGTILEAMRMGMPVVTCRTSGTPTLNQKRETVLIAEIGDPHALALHMLNLLDHPEHAEQLRNNAFLYMKEEDGRNARNVDEMVAQYKAIIAHYRYNTPIPQELLYKPVGGIREEGK